MRLAERLRAVREKVFWTTPIYIYILHQTYATAPEFEHKHRVSGLGHLQPIR